jgi:hypothetical protein
MQYNLLKISLAEFIILNGKRLFWNAIVFD